VTLRAKVFVAQAPLVVALVVVGWLSIRTAHEARRGEVRVAAERMEYWTLLSGAGLLALAVGLFASIRLTSRILRPLSVLAQTARRLGGGDFEARAVVDGDDEIAQLAREVNAMASQLEQLRTSSVGESLQAPRAAQAAVDSLPDPVLLLDIDGRATCANEAARSLFAHPGRGEAAGPVTGLDASVREALDHLRTKVLAGKGPYVPRGLEEAVRLPSNEGERHWLPRATPLYDDSGAIEGVTIVLQDVTRLRRYDELKSDLVATAAHEFKTPLTSLRMAVHLCLEGAAGSLTPTQFDLLATAREDCERLQAIVDDILDLARIQSGRVELRKDPLDPEPLVAMAVEAHRSAAKEKGVDLRAETLPCCEVRGDRERLGVVLANLVSNALRHTPSGGRVTVGCRPLSLDGSVRFEVSDTGEGIPHEYLGRVFDRFFQVPGKPSSGSGLGLTIGREIVDAHRGAIGVESEVGRGSRFWFTLPG